MPKIVKYQKDRGGWKIGHRTKISSFIEQEVIEQIELGTVNCL